MARSPYGMAQSPAPASCTTRHNLSRPNKLFSLLAAPPNSEFYNFYIIKPIYLTVFYAVRIISVYL